MLHRMLFVAFLSPSWLNHRVQKAFPIVAIRPPIDTAVFMGSNQSIQDSVESVLLSQNPVNTTLDNSMESILPQTDSNGDTITTDLLKLSSSGDLLSIDHVDMSDKVAHRRRIDRELKRREVSRREWLRLGTLMVSGCLLGGVAVEEKLPASTAAFQKALGPVNLTRIWQETAINVTVQGPPFTWVALDPTTFQKKQTLKLPGWVPSFLIPPSRVIGGTSNAELLTAAVLAGSVVEMGRTCILYPLLTLKVRIQSEVNTRRKHINKGRARPVVQLATRVKLSWLTAKKYWEEGNLYAGLLPSVLIAAPATGLFYGVRDVVKRSLLTMFPHGILGSDIPIVLTAAFLGDVTALAFRTPFDTLSIRLQAAAPSVVPLEEESEERNSTSLVVAPENATTRDDHHPDAFEVHVGNWLKDSIERLPAAIITDLPFLLSRIALNRLIMSDRVDVGRYEVVVIGVAILCALLTTPFDVARTRILVDSSNPTSNDENHPKAIDGGSGEGLVRTLRTIYNEGDGGYRNLFAGWIERTAYLGIGRACLEPLQLIAYVAIRDAILLELFD